MTTDVFVLKAYDSLYDNHMILEKIANSFKQIFLITQLTLFMNEKTNKVLICCDDILESFNDT